MYTVIVNSQDHMSRLPRPLMVDVSMPDGVTTYAEITLKTANRLLNEAKANRYQIEARSWGIGGTHLEIVGE